MEEVHEWTEDDDAQLDEARALFGYDDISDDEDDDDDSDEAFQAELDRGRPEGW